MSVISTPGSSGAVSGVVVSGTAAAGQVPVASSSSAGAWKYPPGFEVGYDQITANVNITGTSQGSPTTIITCAAHTFDGGAVLVQFFCSQVAYPTAALTNQLGIDLWEGATNLGELSFSRVDQTANQDFKTIYAAFRFTPSAGSHTYLIQAYASSTTGTPAIVAGSGASGANVPAFARFTKV